MPSSSWLTVHIIIDEDFKYISVKNFILSLMLQNHCKKSY